MSRWAGRSSLVALLLCGTTGSLWAQAKDKDPVPPPPKKEVPTSKDDVAADPNDAPPKKILTTKPRPQPDTEIVPPVKHGLSLETTADGILVKKVEPGSVGELADIHQGDLILRLAGKQVLTPLALDRRLHSYRGGTKLELAVLRDAKERLLFLTLPEDHEPAFLDKASEAPKNITIVQPPARATRPVLPPRVVELGWTLQVKNGRVWVADIVEDGIAAAAGFRKGDMLVSFDKTPLTSMEAVERSLGGYEGGAVVAVQVDRNARVIPVSLTVPATKAAAVRGTTAVVPAGDATLDELLRRQLVQEELLTKVLAELQAINAELKTRRVAP
jgi:predicted metalloprotease with PDZ domain